MTIKAYIRVEADAVLAVGTVLEHAANGTTQPQSLPVVAKDSFARVIDPTPGERAADGSYRVRCEMLIRRPFIAKPEKAA